jgi:hypothetical protein
VLGVRRWRELVTDKKMEGSCSTGQSPQLAVVPMEEEEYTSDVTGKGLLLKFCFGYRQLRTLKTEDFKIVNLIQNCYIL